MAQVLIAVYSIKDCSIKGYLQRRYKVLGFFLVTSIKLKVFLLYAG